MYYQSRVWGQKRATILALCVCVSSVVTIGRSGPRPGVVTYAQVFSRGEGGCSAFRIPGIVSLNNTLHVFAECRKYDCTDNGGQHNVAYKRSTDAGASFSALQILLDPLEMFPASECPRDNASVRSQNRSCQFWDPTPIVDRQTGEVFLLTTRGETFTPACNVSMVLGELPAAVINPPPPLLLSLLLRCCRVGAQWDERGGKPRKFLRRHVDFEQQRQWAVVVCSDKHQRAGMEQDTTSSSAQ